MTETASQLCLTGCIFNAEICVESAHEGGDQSITHAGGDCEGDMRPNESMLAMLMKEERG